MLNIAPIFLFCFSRGGSNIFWNVFLSHPHCCSPIDETLQIFGAGLRHATLAGYQVALLSHQPRLFDQWNLQSRRPISSRVAALIDRTFYRCKLKTLQDSEMRYKSEGVLYTQAEVENSRLVAKNNNGLVFLSDIITGIFPDAYFFALVRDPVALYESHKRRRITNSVEQFAGFYNTITKRMQVDQERLSRYFIVRFEDILNDPVNLTHRLYQQADLDFDKVKKLRFRSKPHYHADGHYGAKFDALKHYWVDFADVYSILERDINIFQVSKLSNAERNQLEDLTREQRIRFGYQS